jgi:hypothetical protein
MFFKEWEVLLVDDEPDVLSISKLDMRNFEVYGLPLYKTPRRCEGTPRASKGGLDTWHAVVGPGL